MATLIELHEKGHRSIRFEDWKTGSYLFFVGDNIENYRTVNKNGSSVGRVQRPHYEKFFNHHGWEIVEEK